MLFDTFFNVAAVIVIVGAPLICIVGWIMVTYKVDRFISNKFAPPPYVLTPEEKAATFARSLKMFAETERARMEAAHHH